MRSADSSADDVMYVCMYVRQAIIGTADRWMDGLFQCERPPGRTRAEEEDEEEKGEEEEDIRAAGGRKWGSGD